MPNPSTIMSGDTSKHVAQSVSWLPWDNSQFRRSDLGFAIAVGLCCVIIPLIVVPKEIPVIPEHTVQAPITLAPEVKPEEKKPEPKPKAKPIVLPKVKVPGSPGGAKEEAAKAAPRAAAPDHPLPKPQPPSQMGSPDKPAVQTVRPAQATTDAGPVHKATSPNPTPLPTDTPAPVSHQTGPSAAELRAQAQQRAQNLVAQSGLGSAINGVTSGTSSSPKAVEGKGLLKGGVDGGRPDPKLGLGGGGTGGNGAAKTGVKFGSMTDGDKTGHGLGSISGRGTGDASGGLIKGNGNGTGAGNGTGSGKGGNGSGNGAGDKGDRDDVDRVMNVNKTRLTSAYLRALDDDPSMEGNFTVHIKISPSGEVLGVNVISSDLKNSKLEAQLLAMIKGFNFRSGNYAVYDGKYTFNFIQ